MIISMFLLGNSVCLRSLNAAF
jgi:hypothetical protein